jgi:hypothetical protein
MIQGMSQVPQTAAVAKNTTINVEPALTLESVSENKRKLSMSEDVMASKKIKTTAADETVPHRYLARFCYKAYTRDRENSSILASNFPDQTNDNQIRYFFKDVGRSAMRLIGSVEV